LITRASATPRVSTSLCKPGRGEDGTILLGGVGISEARPV
jgi:hypothetical protein